jgi:ABC-type oligopeptide transport system, periplasmic component
MRKIIINKLPLVAGLLFLISAASAQAKILPYLSLYGEPKYAVGFKNFDYVNSQAPKGGRIVMPAYGGFDSFNPFIFKGVPAYEAAGLTLDTLAIVPSDDISTAYPLVAEKFDIPEDRSYIGFILNPKARFHDGTPVSADDIIFSFKALVEKGAPLYKIYYGDVAKAEKVNDRHVRFYFKPESQNKELPLILAQLPVLQARYWEDKDFAKPELKPMPAGGPYKIVKFEQGKFIILERVKDYWAQDLPTRKGFFNFDNIRYDYYQDTTVTLQALFAGNIDLREEYLAKIWVTGYDNEQVKNGKIKKEEIGHNNTAILQSFVFNLRRPQFADKRVRQAISLAFNFEWANEKLFYHQYRRLDSYFSNSDMAATGKPQGKELDILRKLARELPPEVFGPLPEMPKHTDYRQTREYLKRAAALLEEAGYGFRDGKMVNTTTGEPLEIEVLSNTANGAAFTRVMLPFIKNLEKIGVKMTFRNVELNIFKNRMDNFDFDMAILSFPMSQMPGNEQKEMWGSAAAGNKGSMNLAGVKNPAADKLIDGFIRAQNKPDYLAYLRAFDRVMRHEYYLIPQWYAPYQRVAYRDKFEHPKTGLKVGLQPMTWWTKAGAK